MTRKSKIEEMASEIIRRIEHIPTKKWGRIYHTLNSGKWSVLLDEKPKWWDAMIFNRVASNFEIIFPGKKIFSYEVIGIVLKFLEHNFYKTQKNE